MFGKRNTAEELMKLYGALPDEEKKKFLDSVNGPKAEEAESPQKESTEEIQTMEQPPAEEDGDPADESSAKGSEEQKHEDTSQETVPAEEESSETSRLTEGESDPQTDENVSEIVKGLTDRLAAVETALKELDELKEQMQKYTQAQADRFGYSGTVAVAPKGYGDMTADEMKRKILSGEI